GLPKTQSPFGWMGPDTSVPGILQFLAVFSEVGGGLALIIGLLTPIAALGISYTMLYAIFGVHIRHGDSFVAVGKSSYESAAGYLAVALLLFFAGPGKLSLDALLFGRDKKTARTATSVGAES